MTTYQANVTGLSVLNYAAMTALLSGFSAGVKEIAPECLAVNYVTHRKQLACKKITRLPQGEILGYSKTTSSMNSICHFKGEQRLPSN